MVAAGRAGAQAGVNEVGGAQPAVRGAEAVEEAARVEHDAGVHHRRQAALAARLVPLRSYSSAAGGQVYALCKFWFETHGDNHHRWPGSPNLANVWTAVKGGMQYVDRFF